MAERVGFEKPHPLRQEPHSTDKCGNEKTENSPGASQNPEQLSPNLSEVVKAWPNLLPEIRATILALVRNTTTIRRE